MSKKRISHKCINCNNCSAPSIIEKDGKRKIVYRCEAGVSFYETRYKVADIKYNGERKIVYRYEVGMSHYETRRKVKELLIDDKTAINCIKFSRK